MKDIEARLSRLEKMLDVEKSTNRGKRSKYANEERVSLVIPSYIKEYLQTAAYKASDEKHTVSMTEYLCDLVVADMEAHNE